MAISLISCEDNLTNTKIRCTIGCDNISDLNNIPVGDEDLSELGFANHKLAPWSFALVGEDGLLYYLTTTNKWKPYTNDGSGGGGDKRMVITVTNESGEYSCDKTFEEIYNAGEANSVVIYDGYIYRQQVYTEEDIRYELTDASSDAEMKIAHIDIVQDDSVEYHEYEIESNKNENLVVTITKNGDEYTFDEDIDTIIDALPNVTLELYEDGMNKCFKYSYLYSGSYIEFTFSENPPVKSGAGCYTQVLELAYDGSVTCWKVESGDYVVYAHNNNGTLTIQDGTTYNNIKSIFNGFDSPNGRKSIRLKIVHGDGEEITYLPLTKQYVYNGNESSERSWFGFSAIIDMWGDTIEREIVYWYGNNTLEHHRYD